jgi:DNA-binding transcriptional regulator of glucitol operon
LQCLAIALIVIFPKIAIEFPMQLQAESRAVKTEQVDDSMNRLEDDPSKAMQEQSEEDEEKGGDALEKEDLKAKPAAKK